MDKVNISRTKDSPLVSIIVITYNSAKYVLETLESAKAQTYENIELIISDDGSKDDTLGICKNWLAENKERFVNTEILSVEKNTGIPANCNRGVKASKGEWVKLIAGDDALYPTVIEKVVNFLLENYAIELLQTKVQFFQDDLKHQNITNISLPQEHNLKFFVQDSYKQYLMLQSVNPVAAPGVFIKRKLLLDIGYFDEVFKKCEDYPLWLNMTRNKIKIYYLDILGVKYRRHDNSVTISSEKGNLFCTTENADLQIEIAKKYFDNGFNKYKHFLKYSIYKILNKNVFKKNLSERSLVILSKLNWKVFT